MKVLVAFKVYDGITMEVPDADVVSVKDLQALAVSEIKKRGANLGAEFDIHSLCVQVE